MTPGETIDFKLYGTEGEFDYSELHLDGSGSGSTTPIKTETDPERVMMVTGLPAVGANWSMKLQLSNDNGVSDTVDMSRCPGSYASIYADRSAKFAVVFPDNGAFFTIRKAAGNYETYVNINMASEVALLKHSLETVFDTFALSMLARANP